jgi:polysaccharide biosynthesis/export protein
LIEETLSNMPIFPKEPAAVTPAFRIQRQWIQAVPMRESPNPSGRSMHKKLNWLLRQTHWLLLASLWFTAGCATAHDCFALPDGTAPRELKKVAAPEYVIAPPDVLSIDAVRLVPQPPYKVSPLDALLIQVIVPGPKDEERPRAPLPNQPISGIYRVEPDGVVNLGFNYGSVSVVGMSIPETKEAIKKQVQRLSKLDLEVEVSLAESRALQFIRGDHLVRPDGKVTLGNYGSCFVAGMTLEQARKTIQDFLSSRILEPEISLDVTGYNSMVFYLIFDLDGAGQSITRLPFTGNETVLDAISGRGGLPAGSDRFRIWVARPTQPEEGCEQILPVDWQAITKKGCVATNYQLLPGDRVYVAVDPLIAVDGFLAKVLAPVERVLGIILLGNSTIQSFRNNGNNNNNNGGL